MRIFFLILISLIVSGSASITLSATLENFESIKISDNIITFYSNNNNCSEYIVIQANIRKYKEVFYASGLEPVFKQKTNEIDMLFTVLEKKYEVM